MLQTASANSLGLKHNFLSPSVLGPVNLSLLTPSSKTPNSSTRSAFFDCRRL